MVPSISPYGLGSELIGGVRKPLQLHCEGKEAHFALQKLQNGVNNKN